MIRRPPGPPIKMMQPIALDLIGSCTHIVNAYQCPNIFYAQTCFIRRISVAPNAIQTMDNEMTHFIIYCSNCVRRG